MSVFQSTLLPRAKLKDVLGGRARLVGSRCDERKPRGLLSPIEPRLRMGIPYGDLKTAEDDYLAKRSFTADVGVVVRTILACALAPAKDKATLERPFVVSARLDNLTIAEALELIMREPLRDRARLLYFVHAHALNLARFDREYAGILARADALLPDGIGIRMAANLLGVSMRHNINGTDLFPLVCREAARRDVPLALIGGAPGIAEQCAERMKTETPGLSVPIVSSGFFANEADVQAVVEKIASLDHVIVLVGMGSPRQERWVARHLRGCRGATVLTVGGLFDFYSGRMRRAPLLWRETGMEWAYRLLQEPRRLAKRYLVGNPLFLALALEQKFFRRRPDSRDRAPLPNPVGGLGGTRTSA